MVMEDVDMARGRVGREEEDEDEDNLGPEPEPEPEGYLILLLPSPRHIGRFCGWTVGLVTSEAGRCQGYPDFCRHSHCRDVYL